MTELQCRSAALPDADAPAPAILVVEDEMLIRIGICAYLEECGFRVFEASGAAEAIELLGAGLSVDLAFCDVELSGAMDGIGLAQWIGRCRPGLSVILTSGDVRRASVAREACKDIPFLEKPYDPDRVVELMRALIAARNPAGNPG